MPLTTDIDSAEVFLVVDVHNVVRTAEETRGPVAGFKTKAHGYPTGAVYLSLRRIIACAKHFGLNSGKKICLAFADQENKGARLKMYPKYKEGRVHKEYGIFEVVSYVGKDQERQCDPVRDFMEFVELIPSIHIVMKKPWETDDALAAFAKQVSKRNKSAIFYILTRDRDLWSEQRKRVVITSGPDKDFTIADLQHAYGITNPRLLPLAKALFGDDSDKLKKAVPRVTVENVPEGILDLVKIRKGIPLSQSFEEMLAKHKKQIAGTSLELCLGKSEAIQKMIDIIRLRRNLDLLLVKNVGNIEKMKKLAAWYEFNSMPKAIDQLFTEEALVVPKKGQRRKRVSMCAGKRSADKEVHKKESQVVIDTTLAGRFTTRRGAIK